MIENQPEYTQLNFSKRLDSELLPQFSGSTTEFRAIEVSTLPDSHVDEAAIQQVMKDSEKALCAKVIPVNHFLINLRSMGIQDKVK